jgi:hypothetical protein
MIIQIKWVQLGIRKTQKEKKKKIFKTFLRFMCLQIIFT